MKETICTIAGITGSIISGLFGGWDDALQTLIIFMGIDYVNGRVVLDAAELDTQTIIETVQNKLKALVQSE